jgi:hypothetical protein
MVAKARDLLAVPTTEPEADQRSGPMRYLRHVFIALLLAVVSAVTAAAQQANTTSYVSVAREGYRLSKAEAEALEAELVNSPNDLRARAKILGFYFRGPARAIYGPAAAIVSRRNHILWLVRHHPASELATLSETTIDAAGHSLADKEGYDQLSALWRKQVERQGSDVGVLCNAAKFFQLSDKAYSVSLLREAQQLEPGSREWPAKIGYVYALAILGVEMINQNGLPTSHNSDEAMGRFAADARDELGKSTDAAIVGVAGRIVGQYGLMFAGMFRGSSRFAVDYAPLAETLLTKAQALEPSNRQWSTDLEHFRKLRTEAGLTK